MAANPLAWPVTPGTRTARQSRLQARSLPGRAPAAMITGQPRKLRKSSPDERFLGALADADILMGVIDGGKVRRLMADGSDASLVLQQQSVIYDSAS